MKEYGRITRLDAKDRKGSRYLVGEETVVIVNSLHYLGCYAITVQQIPSSPGQVEQGRQDEDDEGGEGGDVDAAELDPVPDGRVHLQGVDDQVA